MPSFTEQLAAGLSARRHTLAPRQAELKEAAVAVLVRELEEAEVLFIKRAERFGDPWSGQIAFPGGRRSPSDRNLAATAARETREEIGFDPEAAGRRLGPLDEVEPVSKRLPPIIIAPFAWSVPKDAVLAPSPEEVEAVIWVPVSALRDPNNVLEFDYGTRKFPALKLGPYICWGLTHRIVGSLLVAASRVE